MKGLVSKSTQQACYWKAESNMVKYTRFALYLYLIEFDRLMAISPHRHIAFFSKGSESDSERKHYVLWHTQIQYLRDTRNDVPIRKPSNFDGLICPRRAVLFQDFHHVMTPT